MLHIKYKVISEVIYDEQKNSIKFSNELRWIYSI